MSKPAEATVANALPVDAAVQRVLAAMLADAGPRPQQPVPLAEALGRVLAADVPARIAVPAHDNAAMDGYAFAAASLTRGTGPVALSCTGLALAGRPFGGTVQSGEAVRIMTGAALPAGCDTVVPIEQVQLDGDPITGGKVAWAHGAVATGAHVRRAGEDVAPGQQALAAGTRLRPAHIGLLAALGETEVAVARRPRVAVFSSGDELVPPGQPLPPGCIHDSNRITLLAAAQRLGAAVLDLGWVADEPSALAAVLERAVQLRVELVLTSGGISAGDADHTRRVLAAAGEVEHWQLAMRPGRPFVFGRLRGEGGQPHGPWIMALPGNPVAALVAFYALVRPALLTLMGADPSPPPALHALCTAAIPKRPGRSEFPRGVLAPAADGRWTVRPVEAQGAAMLRGVAEANALIVLDHARGPVAAGDAVPVWAFEGLA
jgi:molybdopterin molybdotransferase